MRYWWIVDYVEAKDGNLRPVLIKGRYFTSELRAQRYIDDANLSRRAEIFELSSTNVQAATQELKAKLAKKYRSLPRAMKRAVHQ